MTPDERDKIRRAERIAAYANRVLGGLPVVLAVLNARQPDGYPTRGEGGRSTIAYTDSVLAAVITREGGPNELLGRRLQMAEGQLREIADFITRFQRLAPDAALKMYEQHRCTGGMGKPGSMEWGDPACLNIVGERSTSGVCDSCRMRRYRWEKRQQEGEVA